MSANPTVFIVLILAACKTEDVYNLSNIRIQSSPQLILGRIVYIQQYLSTLFHPIDPKIRLQSTKKRAKITMSPHPYITQLILPPTIQTNPPVHTIYQL